MGLVTLIFGRLTLKLVCESHLCGGGEPFFQIWPLGSRIIDYVRDGRTDKNNAYFSFPTGAVA